MKAQLVPIMPFLKTLLILLLVYFGLRFLFRLSKPYLFRFLAKKMTQKFEGAFGGTAYGYEKSQPEGKVTVDQTPPKQRTSSKIVGEYIDFEEID